MAITITVEATLLRADGTEYDGGTLIKKMSPPYNKHRAVTVEYMDNSIGFMDLGEQQGRIDSMTIECFSPYTAAQIMSDIGNEDDDGKFKLRVPNKVINGADGGKIYIIQFFEANFQPQTVRRGELQIFSAQVSNVIVLQENTYS